MKMPSISIHALMAMVLVIALDCMVVKAMAARPDYYVETLHLLLIAALPMVHILAIAGAMLARGPIRARPFLLGFVVGGWLAILATSCFVEPFVEGMGRLVESTRFGAWINSRPDMLKILLAYFILITILLIPQLVVATVCGWIARRRFAARSAEVTAPRRLAPPLVAVLMLLIPALGIMGYLRWVVDAHEMRMPRGSEAVIDLSLTLGAPISTTQGPDLVAMDGAKVRVERDDEPSAIGRMVVASGRRIVPQINDIRIVRVNFLDGDRRWETITILRCYLRPVSEKR